ncbi:MAG: HGGxSTG domain-containing protein [Methylobacter sp.]
MSNPEQRKRLKAYYKRSSAIFEGWRERGYQYPPPKCEPFPADLIGLQCGAKTKAGTPCKLKSINDNGRCKWHGGFSTGPKTTEGKRRSAMNGFCPKKSEVTQGDKT